MRLKDADIALPVLSATWKLVKTIDIALVEMTRRNLQQLATLGKVCAILEIEPGDVLKLGDWKKSNDVRKR